jgi:hypothetical protein
MPSGLRILTLCIGAGFVLQGVAFLVVPARAAEGLGMALLDGVGRSTQIGDFAAFFLMGGVCMVLGSRPGGERILQLAGGLLAAAAFGRIIAWAAHGAAFATLFIVVEIATSLLCFAVASGKRT